MSASKVAVPTPDEIRRWPATVRAVPDGAAAFGLGPDAAYKMIRAGQFPVTVLNLGRARRVTRAAVMEALGITELAPGAPGNALAMAGSGQVGASASDQTSEARGTQRAA